jgi:hypothetical protein
VIVREFGEGFIEAHDVAGELETAGAERGADQIEGKVALRFGHLLEADALAHVEVLIHPFAPLRIVDIEQRAGELHSGERGDKFFGGVADRLGGNAGGADVEEVGDDAAVSGDAFERRGEAFDFGFFGDLAEALGHVGGIFVALLAKEGRSEDECGDQRREEITAGGEGGFCVGVGWVA